LGGKRWTLAWGTSRSLNSVDRVRVFFALPIFVWERPTALVVGSLDLFVRRNRPILVFYDGE
jgi:hypothetical protein